MLFPLSTGVVVPWHIYIGAWTSSFVGPDDSAASSTLSWYSNSPIPFSLFRFILMFCLTFHFFLQDWALELELVTGLVPISDDPFPVMGRWGPSRAWRRPVARVHLHRERLNPFTSDEV